MYDSIISCTELHSCLSDPRYVIIDCRFDLSDLEAGRKAYAKSHIPGAIYVDLAQDLSGPVNEDTGRHPLPATEQIMELFSRCGIDSTRQVVLYDASAGAYAARMWWMLKYMGHPSVGVLDGGWQHWVSCSLPTEQRINHNTHRQFVGRPDQRMQVTVSEVLALTLLVDSREPERFSGKTEPIDPVAGHIPGAVNYFWKSNIEEDGTFRSLDEIRNNLLALYADEKAENAVFYCGSGVTACQNILSASYAGLPLPRLYVGSWSEWCRDPCRPVAVDIRK